MKNIAIVVLYITTISMISCTTKFDMSDSIKGSGNVVTEVRKTAPFTKVVVSNGIECEITFTDKLLVAVEADDNVINGIITTVENGTLKISSQYDNYINVSSRKVKVSMSKIEDLQTNSGSSLRSMNKILATNINLSTSSGSTMSVTTEAEKIVLDSSSGSSLNVSGLALKVISSSSSGSQIEAKNLVANEVFAESSSGSSTEVKSMISFTGNASSGSDISYYGNPKNVKVEESSGGSISKN
jgi:hypothetical protein